MENSRDSIRNRKTQNHSTVFGTALSAGVNLVFLVICISGGLPYLIPPPAEKSLVLDFVQMEEVAAEEPTYAEDDAQGTPVVKSEAPLEGESGLKTQEASVGDKGDVEVPEPVREKPIDKMSLFRAPGNADADTLADYTAKYASTALKTGNVDGRNADGNMDGTPLVSVGLRSARGKLPVPVYVGQESGSVVVEISVDRSGNVLSATAGTKGTTATVNTLWEAAEKAAMATKFNVDPSAPELQTGTITYNFLLTDGN